MTNTPMAAWLALGEGGTITGAKHAAYKNRTELLGPQITSQFSINSTINSDGLSIPGGQQPKKPDGIVRHMTITGFR